MVRVGKGFPVLTQPKDLGYDSASAGEMLTLLLNLQILNEHWTLVFLNLDVVLSEQKGDRLCLLIFLLPISKYRGFGASLSIRKGVKTGISKYFPVIPWIFTSVLALWNRAKAISPLRRKICTSCEVTSLQEQLLTAYFSFLLWTLRLLLAHSPADKHRVLAPLSTTVLGQRIKERLENTDNSDECLPVQNIFLS